MITIEIETAIAAHQMWSKRLRHIVDGISPSRVTPAFVGSYTTCLLGEWLYGEGEKYGSTLEYTELIKIHQRFHEVAAEIVTLHLAGNNTAARQLLEGNFETLSNEVVYFLHRLRDEAAQLPT
jgi:hypothetical protein